MKKIIYFIVAMLMPGFITAQHIINVPGDYMTIQEAVDAAGYGDTILVSQGRYEENVIIQGNNKAVTLASNYIFSADTIDINNTIIDAGYPQNPNFGMGVLLKNIDTTLLPKVTGFTITGGTGYYKTYGGGIHSTGAIPVIEHNYIEDCSITGMQPSGAGIRVGQGIWDTNKVCLVRYNIIKNCTVNSVSNTIVGVGAGISIGPISAVVEGNTITGNYIAGNSTSNAYGGGIVYSTGNGFYHTIQAIIRNNIITGNVAEGEIAGGGGVAFWDDNAWAHLVMEGNTITGNAVIALTSGGDALGGGVLLENPAGGSIISANIISDNSAIAGPAGSNRFGGGMHLNYTLDPNPDYFLLIEKNKMIGNTAVRGGAINCQKTNINLVNNFISGNHAETYAGGIYMVGMGADQVSSFINNTITQNLVSGQGGLGGSMYFINVAYVILMNNIFYGNDAPAMKEIQIYNSIVDIQNCDINIDEIGGDWTGNNNFYEDPEFIDGMIWDCMNYDAPCSNAGIDSLKVFGMSFYAPDSCIGGNPRPLDGAIDLGACEVDMLYVGVEESAVGSRQSAVACYPNPFSEFTTLEYELGYSATVNLSIYNHLGQLVAVLVDGEQAAGRQEVRWDACDLPAGIYYYIITAGAQRLASGGKIVKY
jgi:hypothetical protein